MSFFYLQMGHNLWLDKNIKEFLYFLKKDQIEILQLLN